MLVYKFNVLEALKEAGYNTIRIRREHLLSEKTMQDIRTGKMIGSKSLDTLCRLLDMQPGNIIKYIEIENNRMASADPDRLA